MSCNYAEGLSPYEHKGVLGIPEKFEPIDKLYTKCELLAQFISQSNHVVVHTGAGISTSAGIPDFRGPNGVWTLEKEGKRPKTNISFTEAKPTKTHMILKKLVECGKVHYIVSQNIDGLHLKSGLGRKYLAELHGNMFVDECNLCKRQFVRPSPVETVGKKCSGVPCAASHVGRRPCRGRLYDGVLDWEHSLPENDLLMAEYHSSIADLSICLGTTLQIVPSGNLPLETAKYGGKLVICNLQPTKHDNKADLIINYYVDDLLERVMNILGLDIPQYNDIDNLTKLAESTIVDWTINRRDVLAIEKLFKAKCKGVKKKRSLIKTKRKSAETNVLDDKSKVIKLEVKEASGDEIPKEIDDLSKKSVAMEIEQTNKDTKFTNGDTKENTNNSDAIETEQAINEWNITNVDTKVNNGERNKTKDSNAMEPKQANEETNFTNIDIEVNNGDINSQIIDKKYLNSTNAFKDQAK